MATGPLNILMFFFMQESNHPTILEKKAARLRKELKRDDLRSQLEMKLPPRQVLSRSLVRPIKVCCSSACAIFTLTTIVHLQVAHNPDGGFICEHHLWHLM